jgi:hypothetical protein
MTALIDRNAYEIKYAQAKLRKTLEAALLFSGNSIVM